MSFKMDNLALVENNLINNFSCVSPATGLCYKIYQYLSKLCSNSFLVSIRWPPWVSHI